MRNTDQYLKKLLKKSIHETLEEKADELMEKIKKSEMEEEFDSPEIKSLRGGKGYDKDEFKGRVRLSDFDLDSDSLSSDEFIGRQALKDLKSDFEDEEYGDEFEPYVKDDNEYYLSDEDDEDEDLETEDGETIMESTMCEQCGGGLREGECMECGYKQMEEGLYDVAKKFPKKQSFDYVQEEMNDEDVLDYSCNPDSEGYDEFFCKERKNMFGKEIKEKLYGKQHMLDKNKNGKLDAEDFAMLRKEEISEKWKGEVDVEKTGQYADMSIEEIDSAIKKLKKQNERYQEEGKKVPQKNREKMSELYFAKRAKQGWKGKGKAAVEEEVEEGNKFTGMLAKARKGDKFSIDGKTYTDTSDYDVNESIEYRIKDSTGTILKLNENELIDLIENIVNEQQTKLKVIGKPKGLATYEKAHKESGKENEEYFKSFEKKMKDYLKDGSKGKFEMEPKHFPKGNGELAKMDKKAFKMTDELEDFNYEIAGQNFPVPDAIEYNEEWMDKLFKGDSMTGNAPGGNALESETNERFNKMRKKNTLKKLKDQSYKRVPQPIYNEKSGDQSGKGLSIKLESVETKKNIVLNEEFDRIKNLFSYNKKTQ